MFRPDIGVFRPGMGRGRWVGGECFGLGWGCSAVIPVVFRVDVRA